ncbi:glutamate-gated chloride channel alpha-like [Penaeus indicus]|uniref:glutamate-gated chloride channel alpha-like n=1 Tax=Penaeus indicus TaxID=29960 RepID=UPI00300C7AAF
MGFAGVAESQKELLSASYRKHVRPKPKESNSDIPQIFTNYYRGYKKRSFDPPSKHSLTSWLSTDALDGPIDHFENYWFKEYYRLLRFPVYWFIDSLVFEMFVSNDGEAVKVGVSWHISRVHEVNINAMTMKLSLRPTITWHDPRINFTGDDLKPDDPNELVPLSLEFLLHTWKPDLFFLDTQDVKKFRMIDEVAGLWVTSNRTFYLAFQVLLIIDCPMKFHSYPFDVQICSITMTSFEYDAEELEIFWLPQKVTYSRHLSEQLPDYELKVLPESLTEHHWCQDCIVEPSSAAQNSIKLSRRYHGHLFTLFLPSVLIVAVSWASFFWPSKVIPARTGLAVTSLLTTVSMYASARSSSPNTDYVKAVDVWFFACIFINVLVLFQFGTVITLKLYQEAADSDSVTPISSKTPAEKYGRWERQVEFASKVGLPIAFLVFNLVFWVAATTIRNTQNTKDISYRYTIWVVKLSKLFKSL